MAQALIELGGGVIAVEPYGTEYLISHGIKTYKSLDAVPGSVAFDGIVSVSVLEHLKAPWQELGQLRERLKPNGWAYLATPNAAGLAARIAGNRWREALRPGHLVLLTPVTIGKALSTAGYTNCRRLKWYIGYRNGIRKALGYSLQFTGLDGELRYLAFN
jgi:SAM-dependent methyltransferase